MNISYFRKTDKSVEDVSADLVRQLKEHGMEITKEMKLSQGEGVLIQFLDKERTQKILEEDHTVIGLVPMAALVMKKEGKTVVGLGNAQLLMGSERRDSIDGPVTAMDKTLRDVVNGASGAGEPKVGKIKLYSTATCPYCRMEKDYLEKNKVAFDLVMVDTDHKSAEDMVHKTGQMGVPVTEVVFDDGDSEYIIGFDKGRLNELLNIKS